jgi:hypothetical protein
MASILPLSTGVGFWSPIVWIVAFVAALVVAAIIRSLGSKRYKPGTGQTAPYLSGNAAPDPGAVHLRGSNLYWGFTEAMSGYYRRLAPLHTGHLQDYLIWFVAVAAVVLVVLGVLR